VPDGVLSGPGTELPDGLVVAPDSSLLGPAVVDELDGAGRPTSWSALVLVEGDPLEVWSAYTAQVAELFPGEGIDAAARPGCRPPDPDSDSDPGAGAGAGEELCGLTADTPADGGRRVLTASMGSVPGDVTGAYVLVLDAARYDSAADTGGDADPWPPDAPDPPAPSPARPRPAVGGPLAPDTVAYEGDEDEYVLLEGSELVTQYSSGSVTGGFGVLLRVVDGADVADVASAYASQAAQFEAPADEPRVVTYGDATVTVHVPPGGAGGYQGEVTAVDRATGDDYVRYELFND
jgi:hypothetical protein